MKNFITRFWPYLLLGTVILLFFSNLFFPKLSTYTTPDYGRSDLWHSKIPTQKIMHEAIRNKSFPLWDERIYHGFPVFAEGEMGFLYLPNLILFKFLPFFYAFNLGFVLNTAFVALGTYLLARSLKLSKAASCLAAITFSFSPIFTLHLHHYNLIESLAPLPWLIWLINSFFNTKRLIFLVVTPFFIAQQHFAGFPQFTVYTFMLMTLFFLFNLLKNYKSKIKRLLISTIFISMLILGTSIASIQLSQTYNLTKDAGKLEALDPQNLLSEFPFLFKNLLTIFDPYILGNPRNGTYPVWQPKIWGIFWETNVYFGIVQLLLIIVGTYLIFFKNADKNKKFIHIFWLSIAILGILLSLGSHAPLHPFFSFPPFSYFRVPSRFLLYTFLAAAIVAGLGYDRLLEYSKSKFVKKILFILIILATVDVFRVWHKYNLVGEIEKWTKEPELAQLIQDGRILTISQEKLWNETFTKKGWSNQEDSYLFYRNFLGQNSNVLFNKSHLFGYESIVPKRIQYIEDLSKTQINEESGQLVIGKVGQKVLDFSNVKYIISPQPVNSDNWELAKQIEHNGQKIYLNKNKQVLPKIYTVNDFKIVTTINDFFETLASDSFNPEITALLEKKPTFNPANEKSESTIVSVKEQNNATTINVQAQKDSILVLSNSYSSGWLARVDNNETEIFAANINSKAVILPAGDHKIEFIYKPKSFTLSVIVSVISTIISLAITIKLRKATIPYR